MHVPQRPPNQLSGLIAEVQHAYEPLFQDTANLSMLVARALAGGGEAARLGMLAALSDARMLLLAHRIMLQQHLASKPHTPPEAFEDTLRRARDNVCWITDTLATLAPVYAPKWTLPQRHFLAAFLATTDVAALLHDVMDADAHSREPVLVLFNSRVHAHAAALGVEGASVEAAGGGAGAGALAAQLRATLGAAKPRGHAESVWVTAAVWTLLTGLCKRAHAELGWHLLGDTLKLPDTLGQVPVETEALAAAPPPAQPVSPPACTAAAEIVKQAVLDAGMASAVDPEAAAPQESPGATPRSSLTALAPPVLDTLVGTSIYGHGPGLQPAGPMPLFKQRAE